MEVVKIVILVKLEDGTVRQVSAIDELKKFAIKILANDSGALNVSPPMDNILIENL